MRKLLFILFAFTCCASAIAQNEKVVIGEISTIHSKVLNEERRIMIHLPKNYEERTEKYPVVYLLDAGTHFPHTTSSTQFLAEINKMPEAIVVGIKNTNRNRDMTTPDPENKRFRGNGGAENFASFISNELIPFINGNYRTVDYNILIGHSLGGFFTFRMMLYHPNSFDAYIAVSPSLWWKKEQLVDQMEKLIAKGDPLEKFLYIAYGREDKIDNITSVNKVVNLLEMLTPPGLRWEFEYMPNEIHSSIPYRAVHEGLVQLFDGWRFLMPYKICSAKKMRDHYASLSRKFGFVCRPRELWPVDYGYEALNNGRIQAAVDYFRYYVEIYPESANAYDCLGEAYMKAGKKDQAVANYEKSLELNPNNCNAVKMLEKIRENGK